MIRADLDAVAALQPERDALWARLEAASFLTDEERRRLAAAMGVTPEAFWRLSLREWRMLTQAPRGTAPLGREELARLMEGWPDGG